MARENFTGKDVLTKFDEDFGEYDGREVFQDGSDEEFDYLNDIEYGNKYTF